MIILAKIITIIVIIIVVVGMIAFLFLFCTAPVSEANFHPLLEAIVLCLCFARLYLSLSLSSLSLLILSLLSSLLFLFQGKKDSKIIESTKIYYDDNGTAYKNQILANNLLLSR